ncbi:MAG: ACT domain-containing protein [Ilumatobacter sp.]|uniref:glycine cleavage system protein R n=1 Tax=Ilumatobacter sp. TaxID=1967498 RepID=UPI00329A103C
MSDIVLTVIGDDRPGLVDALAGAVAAAGGSWNRSQMSRLGGKFAGIAVVSLDADRADDLDRHLDPIRTSGLLQITVSRPSDDGGAGPDPADERFLALQLVGADRPGIVSEVAGVLAAHAVSIVELESATSNAPMSGELLFEASLVLSAPPSLATDTLQRALEEIANELMVDIELDGSAAQ